MGYLVRPWRWLVLVTLVGCGATESNPVNNDAAGAPSTQASEPSTYAGAPSTDVPRVPSCAPLPITDSCSSFSCPATLDDVALQCAEDGRTSRFATACGGTAIAINQTFAAVTWYFDASGKLVGFVSDSDLAHTCADGTVSFASTYGEVCAVVGEPTDACAEVCGGPPIECGDDASCPQSYDDLTLEVCDQGGHLLTNATTCGGNSATLATPEGSTFYCFDPWNRLIGVGTQAEDGSRTLSRGVQCRLQGNAMDWCRDLPG